MVQIGTTDWQFDELLTASHVRREPLGSEVRSVELMKTQLLVTTDSPRIPILDARAILARVLGDDMVTQGCYARIAAA